VRAAPSQPDHATEPVPGEPFDVVIEGGWRLPVRGASSPTAPERVVLHPIGGAAVMPGGVAACAATLEWRSARGLVRRSGRLALEGGDLVLVDAAEAVVMQRREFARVRCAVTVNVVGGEASAELITQTVDLSIGGMLVEHAVLLEVGERVQFSLALPDDVALSGEGAVVRATPFGHRAVRFDDLPHADERRLTRFVFAQEREGRSAATYYAA
jgi:hypothetical protein